MIKKITAILIMALTMILTFSACAVPGGTTSSASSATDVTSMSDTDVTLTESDNAFEMELVGESSEGYFKYYRDIVTDVLYVEYAQKVGYAGLGGLTVMLDPESGLPLTYARYMEIYNEGKGE